VEINQEKNVKSDNTVMKIILWCASLTAIITSVTLIALLRVFGLFSMPGTVDFRGGGQYSVASVQKLQEVWNALNQDFYLPVDEQKMLEYAAAAMADSLDDVYTTYYTKEEMRQFTERSSGIFHGIGVYVQQGVNGRLRITGFLENSPAFEAGVEIDDEVVSVDGINVDGITDSARVINMIKGEAGVIVSIGFYRPSEFKMRVIDIERRVIKTENIFSAMVYAGGDGAGGYLSAGEYEELIAANEPGGIDAAGDLIPVGIIDIRTFDSSAYEYFCRHLDGLLESGARALVIDLRGNPGGDYEQTVKIADRLLGEGVIVYTEDRSGKRDYRRSDARSLDMPIRVLVNGDSCSASEVLAGALKDHGAALLVGEKTFGKGLVQAVLELSDGSGLKYTRSRYFTPSGVCIDGVGIEPDIFVSALPLPGGGDDIVSPDGAETEEDAAGDAAETPPEDAEAFESLVFIDIQLKAALDDIVKAFEKVIDKEIHG